MLAIDPWTPTTLYAGSDNGVVYKTTNSGTTWMDTGLRSASVFALVVDIQDSDTVYAATESGPYKSTNGGQSWRLLDEGLAGRTLSMIGDLALCKIYIGTENGTLETDIGPVLTIHSSLCIGSAWTVVVSHAGANAPVRLFGTSNGSAWELADWGVTNEAGTLVVSGTFADDTAGTHQLQIEVAGVRSNLISFTVTNCGLSQS